MEYDEIAREINITEAQAKQIFRLSMEKLRYKVKNDPELRERLQTILKQTGQIPQSSDEELNSMIDRAEQYGQV